jgi:hypothetical protein
MALLSELDLADAAANACKVQGPTTLLDVEA